MLYGISTENVLYRSIGMLPIFTIVFDREIYILEITLIKTKKIVLGMKRKNRNIAKATNFVIHRRNVRPIIAVNHVTLWSLMTVKTNRMLFICMVDKSLQKKLSTVLSFSIS